MHPRRVGQLVLVALCLVSMVGSSACAAASQGRDLARREVNVDVRIAEQANLNWPLAVQVLIIRDQNVIDELTGLTASDWFAGREAFFRDKPAGTQECVELDVGETDEPDRCSWQWVPGQDPPPLTLTYRGAGQAVVFADYRSPGDHRWLFDPRRDFALVFEEEGFSVEPGGTDPMGR